jgi:uncharacterized protein (UPF0548 family)
MQLVFFLRRPGQATISRLLEAQADLPFSYADVGVTRGNHQPRLRQTRHRAELGTGEPTFSAAVAALRTWEMYRLPWTEVHPAGAAIHPGTVFATVVRHLGFWSVNPCRVVYHEETSDDVRAETFAIGTLPGHAERGEERFRIEWHRADDTVWFEILVFAEPRHWLARLGTPIVRWLQHRFGVEALRAMQAAVAANRA